MELYFKIAGALGLIIVTYGIFISEWKKPFPLYAIGGIGLLIYSIYLKDPIFIPLQIVYILVNLYQMYKGKQRHTS